MSQDQMLERAMPWLFLLGSLAAWEAGCILFPVPNFTRKLDYAAGSWRDCRKEAGQPMARQKLTAVQGRWTLIGSGANAAVVENRTVVIEGGKIAGIVAEPPEDADEVIALDGALVLPGLINLHNHSFSAPLFRGIVDDLDTSKLGGDFVYSFLLPMGALAVSVLDRAEQEAIIEMAMIQLLKTGSTTVMEMWRINQDFFFDVARRAGIRAYGCPYQFSTSDLNIGADGQPTYGSGHGADTGLERAVELFKQHDHGPAGRIRVGLGPHGVDTCSPELLQAVRAKANELGCPIAIHVAQSPPEVAAVRARFGKSPVEHLRDLGILGPDVVAAHCIYATDADLTILREAGATIATCPLTYARVGVTAPFDRFHASGARVGIGTDGYCLDLLLELRAAGLIAKTRSARGHAATAAELIGAVTSSGAAALGRSDLGVIAPGARADLIVVDMKKPHLAPALDPLRSLVWNGSGADVASVIVDGETVVRNGVYLRGDESTIVEQASAAVEKVWRQAAAIGLLQRALNARAALLKQPG